jgi:hypothetical protein
LLLFFKRDQHVTFRSGPLGPIQVASILATQTRTRLKTQQAPTPIGC